MIKHPLNIQFFADEETEETKEPTERTYSKAEFDKVSSELASYKRKAREQLTLEEQYKSDMTEKDNEIKRLNSEIRKNTLTVSLSDVFGADTAGKLAKAIIDGDDKAIGKELNDFVTNMKSTHETELQNAKLEATPTPAGDGEMAGAEVTKDSYKKMTLDERIRFKQENPDLYAQITK